MKDLWVFFVIYKINKFTFPSIISLYRNLILLYYTFKYMLWDHTYFISFVWWPSLPEMRKKHSSQVE